MANRILDLLLEIFRTSYKKIIGLLFREKPKKRRKKHEKVSP
jgi:hypothetical protein